ncbi:DNA excision repair protein ERCC-4 [Plasmodium inui San Antonio 1]|uniref:DNA excision repair protein ERCC-4 n=1 Tax=Plasmodium inui San Antonio 1 TaxID=1237626 RepID=W6ZVI2_9APIC|nr:DNA excision repair protein ERCC-4 [Plasmodium inui San Antonio 1]EUD64792.1 DNA excision repair protein ERCC-4 [Plasmodium inui San Antonio 1]
MYPLYYEKKIVKKLIQHDSLILLADGFNELNILAIFIFYYQNKCLWYEKCEKEQNIFFELFGLNIRKRVDGEEDDEQMRPDSISPGDKHSERDKCKESDPPEPEPLNRAKQKPSAKDQTDSSLGKNEIYSLLDSFRYDAPGGGNTKEDHLREGNKTEVPNIADGQNDSAATNDTAQPGNQNKLIFILNVSPKEYNLFLKYQLGLYNQVCKLDCQFNDRVKINYLKTEYIRNQKSNERIELYIKRGVYFISSNILLIDMLTFKIIPEIIDGIFLCKNHKLIYNMKEVFITELYRKRNKYGFIKGISNNKRLVNSQHIINLSQKLSIKKVYCYPRFHKNVHISLNNNFLQPTIYEINMELPSDMNTMEENLLNLIHYLNLEIKKYHTFTDFDINALIYSDSAEKYTMNYIKSKNLTYNTKKLLKEIIVLAHVLKNLYVYDHVVFDNYLNNIKEADKESIWLYCNEANDVFFISRERKINFLKALNMNLDLDITKQDNVPLILHKLQHEGKYFHKAYEVKRTQSELYSWIHDLVYSRDIHIKEFKKMSQKGGRLNSSSADGRLPSSRKRGTERSMKGGLSNTAHLLKRPKGGATHEDSKKEDASNVAASQKGQSEMVLRKGDPQMGTSQKGSRAHVQVKMEQHTPEKHDPAVHSEETRNAGGKMGTTDGGTPTDASKGASKGSSQDDSKDDSQHTSQNASQDESPKSATANQPEQKIKREKRKSDTREENPKIDDQSDNDSHKNEARTVAEKSPPVEADKVDYPIAIIVDNFYTQKEIYNLLMHKNDNTVSMNLFRQSEGQIGEFHISDNSYNSSSSSSEHLFRKNKNAMHSNNVDYYIPYKMIKNKTTSLNFIKPHVYILCINKNYDMVYTSESFIQDCSVKIDTINANTWKRGRPPTEEGESPSKGRDTTKVASSEENTARFKKNNASSKRSYEDLFQINEYCGNLDFLELFLMKVKPCRIILTKLDLNIFRNIEIYCARLFQYNVYKLRGESFFPEVMKYEENTWMYDHIGEAQPFLKREQGASPQGTHANRSSHEAADEDANKGISKGRSKDPNKPTKRDTNRAAPPLHPSDRGARTFRTLETLSALCNTVEVFLVFYKDNTLYNKYLNDVKVEKTNWLNFIENKNNFRFQVNRNVFNKNKQLFKKVVDSYFLFQKRFQQHRKNLFNFNKALCEEFKNFQEVKLDEQVENKTAFLNNLNTNYISMEEEEHFMHNYRNKTDKKNHNALSNLDEKTISQIQHVLEKFSIDSFNLNFILYSIFNNTKPIVIVDIRELKSDLSYKLYTSKMHIIPYSLLVGDYVLTKDICVERKTIVDLIQSLNNNRLYNQINQMSKYYSIYVLLIEFNTKHLFYFSSLSDKNSIYTKLITLCLQFSRLKILWSPFSLFTVKLFWSLKINAEQPDIFKSLHIDLTLERDAHQQLGRDSGRGKAQPLTAAQPPPTTQPLPPVQPLPMLNVPDGEASQSLPPLPTKAERPNHEALDRLDICADKNSDEENESQANTYKYETINDLFDKNLNPPSKSEGTSYALKRMDSVTNWNALEIMKALPGVTEKNMHLIINNVYSLSDLCKKTVEELEAYMSKSNAKMLHEFLNTDAV